MGTFFEAIGPLLKILALILTEIFDAKRKATKKFELDQETLLAAYEAALLKLREKAKVESEKARELEDKIDQQ